MRILPVVRSASHIAVRLLALGTLAYGGASFFVEGSRATRLWAQTDTVPAPLVVLLSVSFSVCVLMGPKIWAAGFRAARPLAIALAVTCMADAMVWLRLVGSGRIQATVPIPVGLLTGALLLIWAHTARPVRVPIAARTQRDMWNKVLDRAYP